VSESVYSPEYQVFLRLLKEARHKANLSQREVAARLGKSYSYVAKCETGAVRMDIYQIQLYLKAVGMSFLDFMQAYNDTFEKS
jgi:transcriptional regulator with XRE-family HTH domain